MEQNPLYVKNVSPFDLFFHKCPCGELTVHGFWRQTYRVVDKQNKTAKMFMTCRKCGLVKTKKYRLTTSSRSRDRLLDWCDLSWILLRYSPKCLSRLILFLMLWLERRIKI